MSPVVRVDPHVHTQASFDSEATIEGVLERAVEVGLDAVVVTDHDCIVNSFEAATRSPDYGLVGIPGVEVSTADGHLLAVGVDARPSRDRSFEETVRAIRDRRGLAVVPHPFQRSRHGVSQGSIADCDGIEVFNALTLTGVRNRQATRFAVSDGYPAFGASDAHRAVDVGRAYTEVRVEATDPTAADVVEAMRAGRTRAVGGRVSAARYLWEWAAIAGRKSATILPST